MRFSPATSTRVHIPSLRIGNADSITFEAYIVPYGQSKIHGVIMGDSELGGFELSLFPDSMSFGARDGNRYLRIFGAPYRTLRRYHVAGVRNGSHIRLFVDGRLASESVMTKGFRPSSIPFCIGASPTKKGGGAYYYHGLIEQVRVTRGVRYETDFEPAAKLSADVGTILLFDFNQPDGDIVADLSGQGHDGRVVNGEWLATEH